MDEELSCLRSDGIVHVVYGDLYLEEIRKFREDQLAELEMQGVFPLWGHDTTALAREAIDGNFRAVISSVDCNVLDPSYAGLQFDAELHRILPETVDPCGENGEFHTFVHDAPNFSSAILYQVGRLRIDSKINMAFRDLIPQTDAKSQTKERNDAN